MSVQYSPQRPGNKAVEQALQDKSIGFRRQSVLSWSKRIIQGVSEIIEGLTIARDSGKFESGVAQIQSLAHARHVENDFHNLLTKSANFHTQLKNIRGIQHEVHRAVMLESLRLAQSEVLSKYFQSKGVDSENPGSFYQEVRDMKRSLERMRDEVRDHIWGLGRRLHDCGNIEGASYLMPLLVETTVQQLNKPSFVQSSIAEPTSSYRGHAVLDAQREVLIFKAPEHEALKVLLLNESDWGQEGIPLKRADPYRLTITRLYRTGEIKLKVVTGGGRSLEERAEVTWKAYQDRAKVVVPRRALQWAASEFVFCLRNDRKNELIGVSWYPVVELPPVEKPILKKKS